MCLCVPRIFWYWFWSLQPVTTFCIYTFLRLYGVYYHRLFSLTIKRIWNSCVYRQSSLQTWNRCSCLDCLPYVSPVSPRHYLFYQGSHNPSRLAFVTFEDNLLVLSLRAMIMQFVFLMVIAAFCFCGFLYALWTWVLYHCVLISCSHAESFIITVSAATEMGELFLIVYLVYTWVNHTGI